MEYLRCKWKIWYHSLDVNHHGTVNMADMQECGRRFVTMSELDACKGKEVKAGIIDWWKKYIFKGRTGNISEEEFISGLTDDYKADKKKFNAEMTECFTTIFDVLDVNKAGSMSADEYLIDLKAFGHEDEKLGLDFFNSYNPVDGRVPLKVIIDSWIQLVVCDDSSKPDIVKKNFEAGV